VRWFSPDLRMAQMCVSGNVDFYLYGTAKGSGQTRADPMGLTVGGWFANPNVRPVSTARLLP
jgi:hypothetical protein